MASQGKAPRNAAGQREEIDGIAEENQQAEHARAGIAADGHGRGV